MSRSDVRHSIDARPRVAGGLLAVEVVLGRPILGHLIDSLRSLGAGEIAVHARESDHPELSTLIDSEGDATGLRLAVGPPLEGSIVLRTDRLYDPSKLARATSRGRDPESAAIWRLDRPEALEAANEELTRRRTYQPIGRFWAIEPARALAKRLATTAARPNHVTVAASACVLGASALIAWAGAGWVAALSASALLAAGLVLDTADGHLARLQGTCSEFGRWLDGLLDEFGDMALHAAAAWSAYARSGHPAWLLIGMAYGMSKYLYFHASSTVEVTGLAKLAEQRGQSRGRIAIEVARQTVRMIGHADVRWHLWIALGALGRMDVGLVVYATYFALRTALVLVEKGARHAIG